MTEQPAQTRRVVLYGNPVLRQKASEVSELDDGFRQLLADLKKTMQEKDGLGLAANQVGLPVAVFAYDPRGAGVDGEPFCVINPRVVATEGRVEKEEGCLSIPGVYEVVPRPELVRLTGVDEEGRPVEREVTGLLARAFMHETDHLAGRLFIDLVSDLRRQLLADRLREIEEMERRSCA